MVIAACLAVKKIAKLNKVLEAEKLLPALDTELFFASKVFYITATIALALLCTITTTIITTLIVLNSNIVHIVCSKVLYL